MNRSFRIALISAALSGLAAAQFDLPGGAGAAEPATTATLVPEAAAITPGGKVTVGLRLDLPAGWHAYYLNSGGVENSPEITWTLPPGYQAGPIQWPVPEIKDGYAGKSFVYEHALTLLVDLTAPADAKPGEVAAVAAKATWQICAEGCRNEDKEFKLSLPVAATAAADPARVAWFKEARAKIPLPNKSWTVTAHSPSKAAEVVLKFQAADAAAPPPVDFIPAQKFLQPVSAGGKVEKVGAEWVMTLKRATKDMLEMDIPQGDTCSGIVVTKGGPAWLLAETRINAAAADAGGKKAGGSLGWGALLWLLGGMFLGGLILNLMPCVFPVIGLKIMSFVQQAGEGRGKIVAHGVVFTAGVLASFGVLSGILYAAREAARHHGGEEVNWGYQLQNPWVVLALLLLMFVLALNMFGVFEIGASATSVGGKLQSKSGLMGSFFSGVLATVVATPCSAPFLGTAIGAAIALPAVQFFTAFGAMALGLSLPYLVLSVFPGLVNLLPRPGAWMESFKQGMSFLLFATAGYLLWVYVGQIQLENMLGPVFGLSLVAVAAWVYGRWFLPHRTARVRGTAVAVALACAAGGVLLAMPPVKTKLEWEPWSQARVDALLKEGRPVYVDFTAQWCLTCQVNKKRAYTPEVVALMKKKRIVALKADKTNPNPEIDAKMRELGRSAIPVNVLLVPGKEPIITPEILSPGYLTDLFTREVPDEGEGKK